MKQDVKEKWIAALRSGKYKQATGTLRISLGKFDRFCCLGVLCDISDGSWDIDEDSNHPYGVQYQYHESRARDVLPATLREELGISMNQMSILMKLNDQEVGFQVISDWIETNL